MVGNPASVRSAETSSALASSSRQRGLRGDPHRASERRELRVAGSDAALQALSRLDFADREE
jgi:hypothetical protein